MGIINNDHRAKLLTAVQLLHDIDVISDGDVAGSSSENDEHRFNQMNIKKYSPFGRRHFPRDSGCYEGSPVPNVNQSHQSTVIDESANSLDDVVAQCSSEILKRVESARRMKDEKLCTGVPMKGVQRMAKKGLLGGGSVLNGNGDDTLSRGGALSEKSSDSGISSSSLSSGPLKNSSWNHNPFLVDPHDIALPKWAGKRMAWVEIKRVAGDMDKFSTIKWNGSFSGRVRQQTSQHNGGFEVIHN